MARFKNARNLTLTGLAVIAIANISNGYAETPTTHPDSTLYTTYNLIQNGDVNWTVCGSTQQTSGCYTTGFIGPFGTVGSMIEGLPSYKGNAVTRDIYVIDSASSNATLYVYEKTDTVSSSDVQTKVTLSKTVSLPLTGGKNTQTFMAANADYLFIGTNLSQQAVRVKKKDLSVTTIGGFSPPLNISSITANQYGYVTVISGKDFDSGFYLFGPDGEMKEVGGGAEYVLGTMQGILPVLDNGTTHKKPQVGFEKSIK